MDGSYHGQTQYPPYGYLDGRPVIFTPDGYPIEYAPHGALQYPQYHAQDMHGNTLHAGMLHGFAPFESSHNTKHRRSRNGCYTCRARRVKCDERRPSCERCRKGTRDCVYPPVNEHPKRKSAQKPKPGSSHGSRSPETERRLDSSASPMDSSSTAPDLTRGDSASDATSPPSDSASPKVVHPKTHPFANVPPPPQSQLRTETQSPLDSQASPDDGSFDFMSGTGTGRTPKSYLDYLRSSLTHLHYGLSQPSPDLIQDHLCATAFEFRPLLHAVVAFSAYHHAVKVDETSLQDFIFHYAESVAQLRQHLAQRNSPTQESILLTILQLATIEEYLGDWANLINHQKAASKVIFAIYTPDSVFDPDNQVASKIFQWYYHFDLFVSFIGGRGTTIGREWFEAQHQYAQILVEQNPDNLDYRIAERHALLRRVSCDCSAHFQKLQSGGLGPRAIRERTVELNEKLDEILDDADPRLVDEARLRTHATTPPRSPHDMPDVENPWDPTNYYSGPLWSMNHLTMRLWGVKLMMLNHMRRDAAPAREEGQALKSPKSPKCPPPDSSNPEITRYALHMLRLYSAITTHDPDYGAIIGAQAGLTFASNFIGLCPKDTSMSSPSMMATAKAHSLWCRQRLREVELAGYIVPLGMRKHLSDAWGEDVTGWWFPEDEGDTASMPPVIRAIREFVVFRDRPPEDDLGADMKEMNGLFAQMMVGEGSGEVSAAGSGDEDAP